MPIRVLVNTEFVNTDDPRSRIWWDAAVDSGDTAPKQLRRLLAGVDTIEVSEQEAGEIQDWAAGIAGWADGAGGQKPLLLQKVAGNARFVKTE